jgi:protein-disulfide isomerase
MGREHIRSTGGGYRWKQCRCVSSSSGAIGLPVVDRIRSKEEGLFIMAKSRKSISNTPAILIAITLIVGFIAGRATAPSYGGADPVAVGPAPSGDTYQEKKLDLPVSPSKGPGDAPVVIYEISDFQCPFCSRVTGTVDKIAQTWPNDVRVVFKHNALSFHKDARPAAIASMAAAKQGHYWKYHDQLFANQKALKKEDLLKYARELTLDMDAFEKDLEDPMIGRKVDSDQAAAVKIGATGTPAFFVNGVNLSGAKPFAEFKTEIEKQLVKAKELEAKGVARDQIARQLTAQSGPKAADFIKYIMDEEPAPRVPKAPPKKAKQEDTKTVWKVPVDLSKEHNKGPKYAPVTIVEFSDYECPFCSKVGPTYKKIMEEYGDQVRVFFKQNPLSFHKHARLAAAASLAAGAQGKFWEMHDVLFENQKALTRPDLERYAAEMGLNMKKFNQALDKKTYEEQIAADQELSELVEARGTPNHFVNGRKLNGAKPFEDFKIIIDEEIKKSAKRLEGGAKLESLYEDIIKNGKLFNPLDPAVKQITSAADDARKGKQEARIQIVEFSDFECPYCSRVGGPLKQLQSKYPNDVAVSFKQFPLGFHKNAQKAAEASLAANAQGRFWDMHDIMFENQKALTVDKLLAYAGQLDLDVPKFKADLDSGKYAARVKADMAAGQKIGVRGTPSVYIQGRKYSPGSGYTVPGLEKVLAREFGLKVKK